MGARLRRRRTAKWLVRQNLLAVIDVLLVLASLLLYMQYFHPKHIDPQELIIRFTRWPVYIIMLWFFFAYALNLYKRAISFRVSDNLRTISLVGLGTGLAFLLVPFIGPTLPDSRFPAIFLVASILVLTVGWRVLYLKVLRHPILPRRALIVGGGWAGGYMARTLQNESFKGIVGYHIFGYIDDDPEKHGLQKEGKRVLGDSSLLAKYARRLKIEELIVAVPNEAAISGKLFKSIAECENMGIRVVAASDLYEDLTGKVMVRKRGEDYLLTFPFNRVSNQKLYDVLNRVVNTIAGALGLALMTLVLPFVWLLNLLFNRGPMFYSQERVGRGGQAFTIYKLRSMVVDAEKESGPVWAQNNDSRITGLGKFLRKTRLDELPQFWNVFKGDMNLVGPRPERPMFVEELSHLFPFYNIRHQVKPGITGWAQINYKYGNTTEDSLKKLQYDLYYVKMRSILLDLKIIMKTIGVVVKFKGT